MNILYIKQYFKSNNNISNFINLINIFKNHDYDIDDLKDFIDNTNFDKLNNKIIPITIESIIKYLNNNNIDNLKNFINQTDFSKITEYVDNVIFFITEEKKEAFNALNTDKITFFNNSTNKTTFDNILKTIKDNSDTIESYNNLTTNPKTLENLNKLFELVNDLDQINLTKLKLIITDNSLINDLIDELILIIDKLTEEKLKNYNTFSTITTK
jgi:hypothetical protein